MTSSEDYPEKYEDFVKATFDKSDQSLIDRVTYLTLGLAGETGEFVENIKKVLRKPEEGRQEALTAAWEKAASELGDVLWYLTGLAGELGMSLDELAKMNREKLIKRRQSL